MNLSSRREYVKDSESIKDNESIKEKRVCQGQ